MNISKKNAMQIVKEFSTIIEYPINIMDRQGIILASSDPKRVGTKHSGALKIVSEQLEELLVRHDGEYAGALKGINLPILFENEIVGVVGMTGKGDEVGKYGQIIKKMAEILLLENYSSAQKELDSRIRARFLNEWLYMKTSVYPREFIERGLRMGIDLTLARRVFIVRILEPETSKGTLREQEYFDRATSTVCRVLERTKDCVVIRMISKLVCLIPSRSDPEMLAFTTAFQKELLREHQIESLIGVDTASTVLYTAYKRAQKALQACTASGSHLRTYGNIYLNMFLDEIPDSLKHEYVQNLFRAGDEQSIRHWISVLQVYFLSEGSLSATAARLKIHKNTLQNWLKKINEQTGHDPRQLSDAVLFFLAVEFYKKKVGQGSFETGSIPGGK